MRRPWSTSEETYLRTHYATDTVKAIAAVLGRSTSSVKGRVTVMELKKPRQPKPPKPKPARVKPKRVMPPGVRDWLLGGVD